MEQELIKLNTDTLLEKIGGGKHIPGAGSVAALNGLLSASLINTVLKITLKKKKYQSVHKKCLEIKKNIEDKIYPELENIFQKDSEQFDKAIKKRNERNEEENQFIKNKLDEESLEELKISTELPLKIAQNCLVLTEYSLFCFENCYQSVKGDSSVALGNALSSVFGCIGIIELNLNSFPESSWLKNIRSEIEKIQIKRKNLEIRANNNLIEYKKETSVKNIYLSKLNQLRTKYKGKSISNVKIESIVREIQNFMWENRKTLWKVNTPTEYIEILKPERFIKAIKYSFTKTHSLGLDMSTGKVLEVAGIIDNVSMSIKISNDYNLNIQNFTTAHELGHAILHNENIIHRDIPSDGSIQRPKRDKIEYQADKFASFFLMPEKLVQKYFEINFGMKKFKINQENINSLMNITLKSFQEKVKTRRELSRLIANATMFGLYQIKPLHKIFNVSIEAMAIRLEEIELI